MPCRRVAVFIQAGIQARSIRRSRPSGVVDVEAVQDRPDSAGAATASACSPASRMLLVAADLGQPAVRLAIPPGAAPFAQDAGCLLQLRLRPRLHQQLNVPVISPPSAVKHNATITYDTFHNQSVVLPPAGSFGRMRKRDDTRQRMLMSALALFRKARNSVTLDAVLAHSGTPAGRSCRHFPAVRISWWWTAAIGRDFVADILDATAAIQALPSKNSSPFWKQLLHDSDYRAGCPVVALAMGPGRARPEAGPRLTRQVFGRMTTEIVRILRDGGASEGHARSMATWLSRPSKGPSSCAVSKQSTQPRRRRGAARIPAGDARRS